MITTDITTFRGSSMLLTVTMETVTSMSGWSVVLNVSKLQNSQTKVIDDKAGTITDAVNGVCTFTITSSELDIDPGTYYWDVWRTNSGYEAPIAGGKLFIKPSVKKPE